MTIENTERCYQKSIIEDVANNIDGKLVHFDNNHYAIEAPDVYTLVCIECGYIFMAATRKSIKTNFNFQSLAVEWFELSNPHMMDEICDWIKQLQDEKKRNY